jgi:hypothetical protein
MAQPLLSRILLVLSSAAAASACGTTSELVTPPAGDGGSGGGAGATTRFPCEAPQPLVVKGIDTGYDTCKGGELRRRSAQACPYNPDTKDAPCTAMPSGTCVDFGAGMQGCGCVYGCTTDADCEADSICVCGPRSGSCQKATCKSDADCAEGSCAGYEANPGCGAIAFACQQSGDQCGGNHDCPPEHQFCGRNASGTRECQNVRCATGRPLLVHDRPRLAGLARRADWLPG